MVLFLTWLLRWSNLVMCRLSLLLQTFQPTLSRAHAREQGPSSCSCLIGSLPAGVAQMRWHSFYPTRKTLFECTPICEENPPSLCHPPQAAPRPLQQVFSSTMAPLPHADLCIPGSPQHYQAAVAAQRALQNMPMQTCFSLRPVRSLGVSGLQDARWHWEVHSSSDPPKALEMQYLMQIHLRAGFSPGDGYVPSLCLWFPYPMRSIQGNTFYLKLCDFATPKGIWDFCPEDHVMTMQK